MTEKTKLILEKVAYSDWLTFDFEIGKCSYCEAPGEWDEGNIIIEHKPDCIVTMAEEELNAHKPTGT